MCTSSAPKVKPVPQAPIVTPSVVDDEVVAEKERERRRLAAGSGRQSTILAGNTGLPPTTPAKTATGA
jgi:hypothetical protein